jgi:hypothetical protein
MPAIARALLAILGIAISSCAPAITGTSLVTDTAGGKVLLIANSPGGDIDIYDRAFRKWSRIPGVRVEIRRWCASACTQVLGYFPSEQICLWPGARVAFHSAITERRFTPRSAASFSMSPDTSNAASISTLMMFALYPTWLQTRLHWSGIMAGGTGNPSAIIEASEFWDHGYGVCRHDLRAGTGDRSSLQGG